MIFRISRSLRLASLLLSFVLGPSAWASCRDHRITPPDQIRIAGEAVMIVVHQTSYHDARFSTKRGIDEAVRFAKERKIPLIYLQDETPDEYYFMEDCSPDYWAFSEGGEVRFEVTASDLYIVGGHLEMCMSTTLHDIIFQWAKRAPRSYRITYLMDAIYSNGKSVEPSDPFYADFDRFMGIITYGRPGGENWPKLNLLETMGIIIRPQDQLAYLSKVLPHWDRTFGEEFQVEIQHNDSWRQVLRKAPGWNPPTVLFRFVDSALAFTTEKP